jgi:FtsH-binding integral membrane protein
VPLLVNGRRLAISGSFVRVPRPALWPWAGAALVVGLAAVAMHRRPHLRRTATVATGVLAGLAGLTAQTGFTLRDAPSGNVAWVIIAAVFVIAAIAGCSLALTHGVRRAYVAGMIGLSVAVVCLSWVGVFLHGVVVSALPATATRFICAIACAAGLIAVIGVVGVDADQDALRA